MIKTAQKQQVVIIPCSGIGKTYGTVSREAAYIITEELQPEDTRLLSLSKLVMGDCEAKAIISENRAITIDGCKLACATKMVQELSGRIARDYAVLEVYRRYRRYKPQGIAELNEGAKKLAKALAIEIAEFVDDIKGEAERGKNG